MSCGNESDDCLLDVSQSGSWNDNDDCQCEVPKPDQEDDLLKLLCENNDSNNCSTDQLNCEEGDDVDIDCLSSLLDCDTDSDKLDCSKFQSSDNCLDELLNCDENSDSDIDCPPPKKCRLFEEDDELCAAKKKLYTFREMKWELDQELQEYVAQVRAINSKIERLQKKLDKLLEKQNKQETDPCAKYKKEIDCSKIQNSFKKSKNKCKKNRTISKKKSDRKTDDICSSMNENLDFNMPSCGTEKKTRGKCDACCKFLENENDELGKTNENDCMNGIMNQTPNLYQNDICNNSNGTEKNTSKRCDTCCKFLQNENDALNKINENDCMNEIMNQTTNLYQNDICNIGNGTEKNDSKKCDTCCKFWENENDNNENDCMNEITDKTTNLYENLCSSSNLDDWENEILDDMKNDSCNNNDEDDCANGIMDKMTNSYQNDICNSDNNNDMDFLDCSCLIP